VLSRFAPLGWRQTIAFEKSYATESKDVFCAHRQHRDDRIDQQNKRAQQIEQQNPADKVTVP